MWPDPILPTNTFALGRRETQPVWLTFHIPADAQPGEYTGRLRLEAGERTLVTMPFAVVVRDFAMPETMHLKAIYDARGRRSLRLEYFYREQRVRHRVLMDGDRPIGGVGLHQLTGGLSADCFSTTPSDPAAIPRRAPLSVSPCDDHSLSDAANCAYGDSELLRPTTEARPL